MSSVVTSVNWDCVSVLSESKNNIIPLAFTACLENHLVCVRQECMSGI